MKKIFTCLAVFAGLSAKLNTTAREVVGSSLHQLALFKICIIIVLVFISNSDRAFGQLTPISIEQRIDNATVIFEGKVTSKASFWDEAHTHIYTSNITTVYKVFKGNLTATQVEIITRGGIVGNNMEQVTNTLELNEGDVGVFTTIPNLTKLSGNSSLMRLKAYSGVQGFIKYDLKNGSARDPFRTYNNIPADVYSAITRRTRTNFRTIKIADFIIK